MLESLINVAIIGLLAGFIFSMPIAGPISVLLTSNALKGNKRFCTGLALGAAVTEFFYVFAAFSGITILYTSYRGIIPYLLLGGSAFLIFIGIKIFRTKLEIEKLGDPKLKRKPSKVRGGLATGIILNATNPTLFITWLTASFMLFSFASSIGINIGGLDLIVEENVKTIQEIHSEQLDNIDLTENDNNQSNEVVNPNESRFSIFLSLVYAATVSLGAFIWLYYLAKVIIHFRQKINLVLLNGLIKSLGVILIIIAGYLIYQAIILF